ncbi:CGNR zinc finger domain-containing protein [Pseudomonas gingeri]|uniref:CGNR zinc finger domain-containing protein n=1 Tax=Pseudomonas gingeri TaxID=117681 RepID=UPI0015A15377|nr:CGNR zinc finger domain-containing protein [Pseudomonas gingeri]NWA28166.1 CGNR zinc finger domain-containing protein [Pseudomonas gingeri]NWD66623.1 CGNR zinc finger domain-containing protein [Pseudomonas gingeri]
MVVYKWPKGAFVAGHLVLDFLNTVDFGGRGSSHNRLTSYSTVLTWALAANLINEAEFDLLSSEAEVAPYESEKALADLVSWREAAFRSLAILIQNEGPPEDDWKTIELSIQKAISTAALRFHESGTVRWGTTPSSLGLETIGQRLALGLNELLSGALVAKIKQCEGCTWLFIDTSKNHKRRWCSMATCGSRTKALKLKGRR